MEDNTDDFDGFDFEAAMQKTDDFDAADEQETATAASLLISLKMLFDDQKVSNRDDLRQATNYLMRLESMHIDRASDAYGELDRLRTIWRKRNRIQNEYEYNLRGLGYSV